MKLIIDIPEEYKDLFDTERCKSKFDSLASNEFGYVLRKAFENGTPLPKEHGRLIDADVLVDGMEDNYEFCEAVNATPTIIKAESEDKE